jgi:uncharacterized protein (TIGR03437 family)
MRLPAIILAVIASWTAFGQTYTISTFAGGGLPVNVRGTSAGLYGPQSVAVDKLGNVFFADQNNDVLRLDATTGVLTLVAGNGTPGFSGDDGPAAIAQLSSPAGVAVDGLGNVYIADTANNRIRKVSDGVITTFAGTGAPGVSGDNGPAGAAQLNYPKGLVVDSAGNLYIADTFNQVVRKVVSGKITTVAGNGTMGFGGDGGPATNAEFNYPTGLALDSAGNLYIADSSNHRIRRISNGVIATVAGTVQGGFNGISGPATTIELAFPGGVAVDASGNLYVADTANNCIRRISGGLLSTVAGNPPQVGGFSGDNGYAFTAQLFDPGGIAIDPAGNMYIADTGNKRIRKLSAGIITTVAGGNTSLGDNGQAAHAQLRQPWGVTVDAAGNVFIADSSNNLVRRVSNGVITTVAGTGQQGFNGDGISPLNASLSQPFDVAVDSAGNLYIADTENNRVRKVVNGVILTVAGTGTPGFSGDGGLATGAQLYYPSGVAVDSGGNVYIADSGNGRIRKVSNGFITTVAQVDGPVSIAIDISGNLYVSETIGNTVQEISNGTIATVAGNGSNGFSGDDGPATQASFSQPWSVAVDPAGNLYISDPNGDRIRKVSNGIVTTVSGNGTNGFGGDGGPAVSATLGQPRGVAVDSSGRVYIADATNNRIRVLTPGTAPAIAQNGVVPLYSSAAVIQPGSWVSIYGSDLAGGTSLWNGDFPLSLGGTSVNIGGKPAWLWLVSPTQINLQVPDGIPTGLATVAVTTASGTAMSTVTVAPYSPSFSLLGDGKHVAGAILTPNGSGAYGGGGYDLVGPSNTFSYNTRPVKVGETLILYGVGFGPTTPTVPAGQIFSGAASTVTPVTVTIGGVSGSVGFAGLVAAGLYQINVTIPTTVASGDQRVQATVNGVQTPPGPVVAVQ